jgi:hypothetical protein
MELGAKGAEDVSNSIDLPLVLGAYLTKSYDITIWNKYLINYEALSAPNWHTN